MHSWRLSETVVSSQGLFDGWCRRMQVAWMYWETISMSALARRGRTGMMRAKLAGRGGSRQRWLGDPRERVLAAGEGMAANACLREDRAPRAGGARSWRVGSRRGGKGGDEGSTLRDIAVANARALADRAKSGFGFAEGVREDAFDPLIRADVPQG